MAWMLVTGPTWSVVVRALSHDQARQRVLEDHDMAARPWLARDWKVRLATDAEVAAHERGQTRTRRQLAALEDFEALPFED